MEREETVKAALAKFMTKHLPDTTIEDIDDIVLNYIVGVLEDLGTEDGFDVEGFVEMMEAYIPGFAELNSDMICEWMFELADQPSKEKENTPPDCPEATKKAQDGDNSSPSIAVVSATRGTLDERLPEENDIDKSDQACGGQTQEPECEDAQIRLLLEMFPSSCVVEAQKCLTIAEGDMEHATQLMLDRQMDETYAPTPNNQVKTRKPAHKDDKALKASILDKYGFVDEDEDQREHRPTAPKESKKKMVRYINNQVVTTRGERNVEVKKPETEEMKKTYINLKPGRKYRFH